LKKTTNIKNRDFKKHIKALGYATFIGTMGATAMTTLTGCSGQQEAEAKNKFLVIEQQTNGKYIVAEETPTEGPTRAILREYDADGRMTERFMSEQEMKMLAEQEYQKMQNGTSELNEAPGGAGMGLAGTILAVAAGSLMGNMIGNALMNNKNFSKHSNTVNRSATHKARTSGKSGGSGKKSFFGGSKQKSSSTSSSRFGG
jgi:hypothetical protein